ncbi:TetR/AcrR family transcriptional regulator [Saccharothrix saharensis]|uniref:TetR/AcrR family transcriptional regulator n=1 Tax=Saccharothrix saharensis TaxID=571190 RepID=UPI00114DE459|nr:TetR family transcriptional regulator [Saccharothrix saharensis]
MNFQRARTDEQRNERRRQILGAAAAMLAEMPVAELSLTALSRRVCLAKANVLRYFDSREAVLLELLEAQLAECVTELESAPAPDGSTRERADRLADLFAVSLAARPMLCDLVASQATVLERNISVETAIRHKRTIRESLRALVRLVRRHLPEFGDEDASALVETVMLTAVAAWPASRPPRALLAAYEADPSLAALRVDFADAVRRSGEVTAAGLLARRR